jgi:hypothetical protein
MMGMTIRRTRCMMSFHAVIVVVAVGLSALVGTAGAERTLMYYGVKVSALEALEAEDAALISDSKTEVDDLMRADKAYIDSELGAVDAMMEETLQEVEVLMANINDLSRADQALIESDFQLSPETSLEPYLALNMYVMSPVMSMADVMARPDMSADWEAKTAEIRAQLKVTVVPSES